MKKILPVFFVLVILSCSDDDDKLTSSGLTSYDQSVIEYFSEIALTFEFGSGPEITRKWTDEMRIFVGGSKTPELLTELSSIVAEINELATDDFSMRIVSDSLQMNYYLFFGSAAEYGKKYPGQAGLAVQNWGLFYVYWDAAHRINYGSMYVDINRANAAEEKHLLREELTQSLGLANDSKQYDDSIFQQDWTTTTEYANIDKDLIRLLYHPQMEPGLSRAEARTRLTEILLSEK